MPWVSESWAIVIPNPHDIQGQWVGVASYDTAAAARDYVMDVFGGDEKGRIYPITPPPDKDEGWLVDLPDPAHPEDAWVFVGSFPTKKDAVKFVKDYFYGDSKGRFKVIDVMQASTDDVEERGPRDWSPRWKREKGRKRK